ncbi:MAG: fatty acid desaturase [Hormoscilla sp. SP5CHS1]|nr:fatty acid desaturase [Hormoscilla sp. SP5CHS1]
MLPHLRYTSDWRSLAFLAIAYFLLLFPLLYDLPPILALILVPVSGFQSFCVWVINHNHMHLSIFKQQWANLLLNIALTLPRGYSATEIVSSPIIIIITFITATKKTGWDRSLQVRALASDASAAIIKANANAARESRSPTSPHLSNQQQKSIFLEKTALGIFILAMLAIGGVKVLIFVLLPWAIGTVCLLGINLLQHDGGHHESPYNHSRNFTDHLGNWFFFNNGYHTIHHLRSTQHWSLLPQGHDRLVKPYIAPS